MICFFFRFGSCFLIVHDMGWGVEGEWMKIGARRSGENTRDGTVLDSAEFHTVGVYDSMT